MPISASFLGEFRRRIQDLRHSKRAMGLAVVDPATTSALAEITNGHLIVTVSGGAAPNLDLNLTGPRYDTIGALYQVLSRSTGYRAVIDEDADLDHSSIDLEPFGPLEIKGTGVDLTTHKFSDIELEEVLGQAITKHNPAMTLFTIPPPEFKLILPLAHAIICRNMAFDAIQRRGLAEDGAALDRLAKSYEAEYEADRSRQLRAIMPVREANPNKVFQGDFTEGNLRRRSLRTGFITPLAEALEPDQPIIVEPDEHDVEDDNIRIRWERNVQVDHFSYELWMDNRPDVVREREGGLVFTGPISMGYQPAEDRSAVRSTTSKLVFRGFGPNSGSARSTFSLFVEEFGQLVKTFSVGRLESSTTYYFRLYVISINYIAKGSNVISATTKPLRARFHPHSYANVLSGQAGTVVTLTLDTTKGAFTAGHVLQIGEKVVTPTIIDPYHVQFTVPSFQQKDIPKDLSIISPGGMVDIRNAAFTVY